MPLPLPRLDNRTFADMVADGRMLLPVQAPNWTDHNIHDPGITLLELFAWLTEVDVYRLDRTLEAAYRSYLRLVGVEMRPAQVADTILVLSQQLGGVTADLPAGVQVGATDSPIVFQTVDPLHVSQARLKVVFTEAADAWLDQTIPNQVDGKSYQPFGALPTPGCALYLGFDLPFAAAAVPISLYVWSESLEADRDTRQRLMTEFAAAQAEASANCPSPQPANPLGWAQHYSVRTVWEYRSYNGHWHRLDAVADETRSLTLSGSVSFLAPVDQAPGGPDDQHFFIRCRVVSGHFECPPAVESIAVNAVRACHAADVEPALVMGPSSGRARQQFRISDVPMVPESTELIVLLGSVKDKPWHAVQYWDRVGPHERAYQELPELGAIVFGDGRSGRVPPSGAVLTVRYQIGSGAAGNVHAGTLTELLTNSHNDLLVPSWSKLQPALKVSQPCTALGGCPAETLAEAQARAITTLAAARGAITLDDFETLSCAIPGVPIARAHALTDYHPVVPCFPAPGSVTVVVVPPCPDRRPVPGADLLEAVGQYLGRRRMLTTEVHVIPPCYTPVVVHARLHAKSRADTSSLVATAQRALDNYFHPLHGGPEGTGWPIGRDVYRAEILALLNQLPGVAYVDELGLATTGDLEPRCGNLSLCPDCLVDSGEHRIVVSGGWSPGSQSVRATCK